MQGDDDMDNSLLGNPTAIFNRIQFCHDLTFEACIPAIVRKVNADHTAFVQPLMNIMSSTDEIECSPILVTTYWDFHGDFEIHHPLNVGDTGWLIAADRNTDLIKQYNCKRDEKENVGAQNANNDKNLHKYRFGFFFPDRWDERDKTVRTVPEELQNCFYIQDRNGWAKFLLDEDGNIAITAKSAVKINSETVSIDADAVAITAKSAVKINSDSLAINADSSATIDTDEFRVNDTTIQELLVVIGNDGKDNLKLAKIKFLRSAILSSEDITISGGSGNWDNGAFAYNENTHTVHNCWAIVGREQVYGESLKIEEDYTGYVYVQINHTVNSVSIEVKTGSKPSNTDVATYYNLYWMKDGKIITDCRAMPCVPIYE